MAADDTDILEVLGDADHVSELIKRMEEHYGVQLFARGARRLVLTPAGTELVPYARLAVAAATAADRALRSLTSLTGALQPSVFYAMRATISSRSCWKNSTNATRVCA